MESQNSIRETIGEFLSNDWIAWVTECRLSGWNDPYLIEYLVNGGYRHEDVINYLQTLNDDPIYKAANIISQRLKKLESLFGVKDSLEQASVKGCAIERRSNLSADEFLEEYYAKNQPVIITDIVEKWNAFNTWTPELFGDKYGNEVVEVMMDRESDPEYEINAPNHKFSCTMREYVSMLTSSEASNNFYLVANNYFFATNDGKNLLHDLLPPPTFLDPDYGGDKIFLWFGPAGTITPLHHDEMNILLAQIRGRKKVVLISPCQTPRVYNDIGVFSRVDCENPDLEKYPLYDSVRKIEFILNPGEALFLPVGWWHHVRAMDASISVSFINFKFHNYYGWRNPSIVR